MDFDFSFLSDHTAALCKAYFKTFLSMHTCTTYYSSIREFFTLCGKHDISEISFTDCMEYVQHVKQMCIHGKIKETVACAKKKHLSGFFSYIKMQKDSFSGIPDDFENYFYSIQNPYTINEAIKANRVVTLSDIDALAGYLMEHDLMCMAAVMFSFKMLLRSSEFLRLKFSDIFIADDENNSILRIMNNNEEERYLSMPSDIYLFITEKWLPASGSSEYIFPGNNGTITIRTLRYRLTKACNTLNIGPYSFNDLRNSGISYAVSNGASINLIAKAINLKSPSHISRLGSLSDIHFTDAGNYVNVIFTGKMD